MIVLIKERLTDPAEWETYLEYKTGSGNLTKSEETDLRQYIENREYIEAAGRLFRGEIPLPEMKSIGKSGSREKRRVFIYAREINYIFKLLTFILMRRYDGRFCDNLYSFRVRSGVNKAVGDILLRRDIGEMYSYKTDISDYFNSIDISLLLPDLKELLKGEDEIYRLFEGLLCDDRASVDSEIKQVKKGVMAGVPFSVFLANLYLKDLDYRMKSENILYARYSDDIIVFAPSSDERDRARSVIVSFIAQKGLEINPSKESETSPGEKWEFLGFSYLSGEIDVSASAMKKLKAKIRRRARALKRWQARKGATSEQTVRAFLRAVNKKFYSKTGGSDLTWTRWYFPVINTDRSLREIDSYVAQWARYVYTGRQTKSNYSVRYETLKELGFRSLVNSWYKFKNGAK